MYIVGDEERMFTAARNNLVCPCGIFGLESVMVKQTQLGMGRAQGPTGMPWCIVASKSSHCVVLMFKAERGW